MSVQHSLNSDNRADYQAAFLRHVHQLLQLAYESLTPSEYQTAEEDDITGDLCKHMRHLTEEAPKARWMRRYSIHDQDPENDVKSAKTGKPRKGKRRPKVDIRLVSTLSPKTQRFCIEAKRLYRSDSVNEYVNESGVGAFISGEYACNDVYGGMLGYIQTDSLESWLPKLKAKIRHDQSTAAHYTKMWASQLFSGGPASCHQSRHRRENGTDIVLFHVMFIFTDR